MSRCPLPFFLLVLTLLNTLPLVAQSSETDAVLKEADAAYDKHNYREAAGLYQQLLEQDKLPAASRDQIVFRQADSTWRNLTATMQSDPMALAASRKTLSELAAKLEEAAQGGRPPVLWADIQESLGDSYWVNEQFRNWNEAWQHYSKALAWWGGSPDINVARERYLAMVFRAARPPKVQPYWRYGNFGNWLPENILRNAIEIAQKPEDKAHANYLLGMSLMRKWGEPAMKAGQCFEAAISADEKTPWGDDALFQYAQWAERYGSSYWNENGNFVMQPDFALALKLYRQLLERYPEGESQYWRQAQNRIERITDVQLNVNVHQSFVPGSVVEFAVGWRNIDKVEIGIYAVDLADAFRPEADDLNANPFGEYKYDLDGKTPLTRLTREANDQAYAQQSAQVKLNEGLDAGAYVIQTTGDDATAQSLLLVTGQQLILLRDGSSIIAWSTDAVSGKPQQSEITLWLGYDYWTDRNEEQKMSWITAKKMAGEDGLARFTTEDFPEAKEPLSRFNQTIAIARLKSDVSVASGHVYLQQSDQEGQCRVYAYTDRPAYRPGDTIHWKATARIRQASDNWRVPNGEKLNYKIYGPQGEEVESGAMDLNEYGSMWGEFPAKPDWKLGIYRIEFRHGADDFIGQEQLFRLEEYKLPEFKVSVSTAKSDGGTASAYRLGDNVEIEILADYYFGGAVANAEVQVQVRQSPYYHYWQPPSRYPWYDAMRAPSRHYGGGQIVLNETLKTDAEGRAKLTLPTDKYRQDSEFSIEARVVDESRREVTGRANIRVTRAPYFIYLNPERTLYRPGETAGVTIKALNANDEPVQVEGRLRLTREEWVQVWRGPDGEEISGQEYQRRRKQGGGLFSSALNPNDWTVVRQGYDVEELKVTSLNTNADGEATFEFTVPKTGYYRVYWVSRPDRMAPIKRDAAVWVADSASQSIGYHGELKIVADEASFREGQTAPVMITTPEPDRWVLFSVQGGGLLDTRVVHLEGNVKLVECAVDERWIPKAWLQANANYNLQIHQDRMAVNVPPEKHFIDVTVTPNAETYQPRDKATAMITTRDVHGRPVPAEVAFSVFDEAVLAIQPTLAPDPREFFYGELRNEVVQTITSQQQRRLTSVQQVAQAEEAVLNESSVQISGALASRADELGAVDGFAMAEGQVAFRDRAMAKSAAAPMPVQASLAMDADKGALGGAESEEPAVVVRNNFQATVFWEPAVITDANGQASVEFEWPDNVTTWNLEARAVGLPSKFGEGEAQTKTRLPLIARLQTPRFLVTGDEVMLTGVINNNLAEEVKVQAELVIEGGMKIADSASQSITIPANGSTQVNWKSTAESPGEAKITLTARGVEHADAMELSIPVFEHGIDKFIALSGKMSSDRLALTMDVPDFRPEGASFQLYLSPSIATTMLDALPYLARYPYGCTEQTMSRFLPAVIVARTLQDLNIPVDKVMTENFGGIEPTTPEEIYQVSKPGKEENLANLDGMVEAGVARLQDFQHADGGWGWWKRGDSDAYMTAYVIWGLTLAQQAGREVPPGVLTKGRDYLGLRLVDYENRLDMQSWILHALASEDRGQPAPKPDKYEAKAFANLWKNRDQLNAYTRALTALSAQWLGFEDEARILTENLANGVKLDENPQGSILLPAGAAPNSAPQSKDSVLKTAHWGEDGVFWRWSNGGVEATAFVLMAMTEITPDSELIEPTMNWLVKNRRGAQWNNTRDTAIVVLALNAWLRKSGELEASGEYTAMLNGESVGDLSVTPETILTTPRVLSLPVDKLKVGANEITLQRKAGEAPLYFSARFNFFTLEDPIAPAGNELFVTRDYRRTYPIKTLLDGYTLKSDALTSGGTADSGDRIQAAITLEAKNNLEYVLIEDLKPAGFEAVELQSGGDLVARELRPGKLDHETERYTGRERWVYQELRDRQIACFIDKLPQGLWEIRYELRAETPGEFSALPVLGEAMYVPEIRANSAEFKVNILEE